MYVERHSSHPHPFRIVGESVDEIIYDEDGALVLVRYLGNQVNLCLFPQIVQSSRQPFPDNPHYYFNLLVGNPIIPYPPQTGHSISPLNSSYGSNVGGQLYLNPCYFGKLL